MEWSNDNKLVNDDIYIWCKHKSNIHDFQILVTQNI